MTPAQVDALTQMHLRLTGLGDDEPQRANVSADPAADLAQLMGTPYV